MRKHIIMFWFLIFVINIFGQVTISGNITVENTSDFSGVTVNLIERNQTFVTQANGNYNFDYVPIGNYTILVVKNGYLPQFEDNITVGNSPLNFNFTLMPGDINQDCIIDLLDRVLLSNSLERLI